MRSAIVFAAAAAFLVLAGASWAAGSPAAGKVVWNASGCGGCHTFAAAKSTGKVGPRITKAALAASAKRAKEPVAAYIRTSIVNPGAYVAKGFPKGVMQPYKRLTKKQLDDVVAFVQKG